jgi:chromosome segregation ATPase
MERWLIFRIGESGGSEWRKSEKLREKLEETVLKLVDKTTDDLEKAKKKVLKKMDAVIEARSKEVTQAKKAIEALETVNRERKEEIKDLKIKSTKEINNLHKSIRELNKQLVEFLKEKEDAENFFEKQREARLKKEMDGQRNINLPIQDPQAKITRLEKDIDDLEMELKIVRGDRD